MPVLSIISRKASSSAAGTMSHGFRMASRTPSRPGGAAVEARDLTSAVRSADRKRSGWIIPARCGTEAFDRSTGSAFAARALMLRESPTKCGSSSVCSIFSRVSCARPGGKGDLSPRRHTRLICKTSSQNAKRWASETLQVLSARFSCKGDCGEPAVMKLNHDTVHSAQRHAVIHRLRRACLLRLITRFCNAVPCKFGGHLREMTGQNREIKRGVGR